MRVNVQVSSSKKGRGWRKEDKLEDEIDRASEVDVDKVQAGTFLDDRFGSGDELSGLSYARHIETRSAKKKKKKDGKVRSGGTREKTITNLTPSDLNTERLLAAVTLREGPFGLGSLQKGSGETHLRASDVRSERDAESSEGEVAGRR
jgi:hypothetical protein